MLLMIRRTSEACRLDTCCTARYAVVDWFSSDDILSCLTAFIISFVDDCISMNILCRMQDAYTFSFRKIKNSSKMHPIRSIFADPSKHFGRVLGTTRSPEVIVTPYVMLRQRYVLVCEERPCCKCNYAIRITCLHLTRVSSSSPSLDQPGLLMQQ